MSRQVRYQIEGKEITLSVEGEGWFGADKVLLDDDDNLIADTTWFKDGFTVLPFIETRLRQQLTSGITTFIRKIVEQQTGKDIPDFKLEEYHQHVTQHDHQKIMPQFSKCFSLSYFPIAAELVVARISEICGLPLQTGNPDHPVEFPQFCLRIVRPGAAPDFNPPHKDAYLEHLRNAVNIYAPLAGSDAASSICLIAGSHLWPESWIERTQGGALFNNVQFNVPCILQSKKGLDMIRPNPGEDEVLVFSPNLIHGLGINNNSDATRVSLEMRFWRRQM